MKLKLICTGRDGTSAELLMELAPNARPDDVRDAALTYEAALKAGLGLSGGVPRSDAGDGDHDQTENRSTSRPPRNGGGGGGKPNGRRATDPPTNGRQLLAWAGDRGLKPRVYKLKDAWGFPDQIVSWGEDEAQAVYHELIRETDERAAEVRNGHAQNGYHRPRS